MTTSRSDPIRENVLARRLVRLPAEEWLQPRALRDQLEPRPGRLSELRAPLAAEVLALQRIAGNRAAAHRLNMVARQGAAITSELRAGTIQRVRYPGRHKPKFDQAIEELDHVCGEPRYTAAADVRAGGSDSSVRLGPTGSWLSSNSDADANLPAAMVAARNAHPGSNFKAGHLLNACFGGDGKSAKNITILSSTGNANHRGFDEPVKRAVLWLKKAYQAMWKDGIDVAQETLGIDVRVQVTGAAWGAGYPDSCIFSALTCSAVLQGVNRGEFQDERLLREFDEAIAHLQAELVTANANGAVANPP